MNKPLFNYTTYPKKILKDGEYIEYHGPKGGSKLLIYKINDITTTKGGNSAYIQMFDSGFKIYTPNFDIKYWNGCVFEDIDYKKYIKNNDNYIVPEKIYEDVWNYMIENYKDIIYYGELSRSCKGYHFIFYFNVGKSLNNFLMCKAASTFIIKKAFKECGYKKELNYDGVYDDCTDSIFQLCYITLNERKINEEITGNCDNVFENYYYSIKNEYERIANKTRNRISSKMEHSSKQKDDKWDIKYSTDEYDNGEVEYMNHHQRYYLFCSLSGLCGNDDEMLKKEWEKCAMKIPEQNGHTKSYYCKAPYINDWNKKRTGNEYIDSELLKKFGYEININIKEKYENTVDKKTKPISKKRVYL